MRSLMNRGLAMSPEVEMLASLYAVKNDVAEDFLTTSIKETHGVTPRYAHAGMTHEDLGVKLDNAVIHVLATPENDIDGVYLGEAARTPA